MYATNRAGDAQRGPAGQARDVTQATDVYVARQPVFDRRQRAVAYELLYRSGAANVYDAKDGYSATAQVIVNAFMAIGIEHITGGSRALINFPEELLLSDYATVLPKEQVIIEVLETVEPTPEVIDACARLKKAGYQIALDDFVLLTPDYLPLLPHTDFIKVDFRGATQSVLQVLPSKLEPYGVKLLAEKVETMEEFEQAVTWGFELFQGYFFCRPQMLKGQDIPASRPTTCG